MYYPSATEGPADRITAAELCRRRRHRSVYYSPFAHLRHFQNPILILFLSIFLALMASGILSRALTGIRFFRASPPWLAQPSSPAATYSSFLKKRAASNCLQPAHLISSTSRFLCSTASAASNSTSSYSATQAMKHHEPVASPEWLHANLREPDVKVLDASWYMPDEQRNSFQEYQVAHIPGALFFDVDGISDRTSNLPHMLPTEEAFSSAVSALGIYNKDGVVVYDGKGIFSAARVWWMFRAFGHDKVWVLDGGLPQWRASGFDVESSASGDAVLKASAAREAVDKVYRGQAAVPITFEAKLQPHLVWTLEQIKLNIESQSHQHVDARSQARFDGVAPEPRKGIRGGHVPGSKCIPFNQMLDSSQMLLPEDELIKIFKRTGISLDQPVVTSCGTGVTACILALGLHRLGLTEVPVYDGSWTEWGTRPETPVESHAPTS